MFHKRCQRFHELANERKRWQNTVAGRANILYNCVVAVNTSDVSLGLNGNLCFGMFCSWMHCMLGNIGKCILCLPLAVRLSLSVPLHSHESISITVL